MAGKYAYHDYSKKRLRCCRCEKYKNKIEFHQDRSSKSGYQYECKECRKRYQKKLSKTVQDKRLDRLLRRTYGISLEEYHKIRRQQKNKCAICQTKTNYSRGGIKARLCVDHDHKTGKVRGLLCHKCNRALGLWKDSLKLVKSAIRYLEK